MNVPFLNFIASLLFALAVVHTFSVGFFAKLSHRYPKGSVPENVFHLLSEVEVVFGLWAGVYAFFVCVASSPAAAVEYLESRNYTEPVFVFVIMVVCATRPVLNLTSGLMNSVSKLLLRLLMICRLPVNDGTPNIVLFVVVMSVGPLLGSLITEPAAMTVCALLLLERFYKRSDDLKFKYAMTGLLFVNISIGGTLTSFAAPPVLMVAQTWNWDSMFMLTHFGWKAALSCIVSTGLIAFLYRRQLKSLSVSRSTANVAGARVPIWLTLAHVAFVALIVLSAHHITVFVGLFLFFIGLTVVTRQFQSELKIKDGLLVGVFLGGLVVLGGPQGWWIEPLLTKFDGFVLFAGAAALTALTDNAAITYLGSLVPNLSHASKYALVAGAVTGGGLTVIANAPNPAGFGILNDSFGEAGMSPLGLLKAALIPTAVAGVFYWFL